MMEVYEGVKNDAHDMCDAPNAPNATANTPTREGQQPELWSPAGEITNQIEVKSEENQLDNVEIHRATSSNARRLTLRVFTKAQTSAKSAMK